MTVAHDDRFGALRSEPPLQPHPHATLGSLAARFAARAVDYLIVVALEILGLIVIGGDVEPASRTRVLLSFVILSAVEATLLHRWGRTPGKAAFGLSVTTTDGGRLPWWRAAVRALIAWSPAYVLAAIVDPMAILIIVTVVVAGPAWLRPDRRALHDLVMGSTVHGRPPLPRRISMLRGGLVLLVAGAAAVGWALTQRAGTDRALVDRQTPAAFGTELRFSPPPRASTADVYMAPLGSCAVTTDAGTPVSMARADDVVASTKTQLEWAYRFNVTSHMEYVVTCGTQGTQGRFAVVAESQPSTARRAAAGGLGALAIAAGSALLAVRRRDDRAREVAATR